MLRKLLLVLLAAAAVVAQYSFDACSDTADVKGTSFPILLAITLGLFTSIDLVTVRRTITYPTHKHC